MWLSTIVDFLAGNKIHGSSDDDIRKRWLMVSVLVNLGLLGFFKYFLGIFLGLF